MSDTELESLRAENERLKAALSDLAENTDILMQWCVKNVDQWSFPQYDWTHRALAKAKTVMAECGVKLEQDIEGPSL